MLDLIDLHVNKLSLISDMDDQTTFLPLIDDGNELEDFDIKLPDIVPILPIRNTVLFPGVIIPINIGRDKTIKLVNEAYENDKIVGIISQKEVNIEDPTPQDLHSTGTIGIILKILKMPDNSTSMIIQGRQSFKIDEIITTDPYYKAKINIVPEKFPDKKNREFKALVASLKDSSIKIINLLENIPQEAIFAIKNIERPGFLINYICSNSNIKIENKQLMLNEPGMRKRGLMLLEHLSTEMQELELKDDIQSKVQTELDKQQKEYILNKHMKMIRDELGDDPSSQEIEDLKKLAKKKKWNKDIAKVFKKELEKLERINSASPDYSVHLTYLQVLLELPWNEYTKDNFDLKRASNVLDKDHFGLEEVKDRILEHLAILKLKGDLKSPIICLYGPPGVGKTSLGKSIAKALKRKYIRMSLGGLHDEAEIRGHRKTYIGAMPGRVIQNLKKVKSSNPVFVLDEIDKVGADLRGDPSFALLEVLDPEQNNTFYDNYLEVEYDLSKIMFIATANTISAIKPALRDRMEMINVTGYIVEEKIEIARRHLVPQQLDAHGVKKTQLKFSKPILEKIIENYTRESGVRELNKKIARVIRKIAKKIGLDEKYNITITSDDIIEYLGPDQYLRDKYEGNEFAGVVTGLAWTAVGGEILFVETSLSKGKGGVAITGNVGNVMKESSIIALEYLKSHASKLKLNEEIFDKWNVHIHIPEGAIPKDGPSAGITMVTSLASAFTQRKIKNHLAMTGEITLRGKVLPVGGIKEKILAAKRANIKEIILSTDNRKDIEQIKDIYIKGIKFTYVNTIVEVWNEALLQAKVSNPLKID